MKTLAFANAYDPEHGSEPGAGWVWAQLLARFGETWVITRENNRAPIERRLPTIPRGADLRFVYVDLPRWARKWKKGSRGARVYYLLWQVATARRARTLSREQDAEFDLHWHLTFANVWMGTSGSFVGKPSIYGPVGGGVGTPWGFLRSMAARGAAIELSRTAGRTVAKWINPLAVATFARTDLILTQNPDTVHWLPRRVRRKAEVLPNVAIDSELFEWIEGLVSARNEKAKEKAVDTWKTAVFGGRFIPWKGYDLAGAIAETIDWRLLIYGSGPDEGRLMRPTSLKARVDYFGLQPRSRVVESIAAADAMLFPSLHDEASFAVAEARPCGVPVNCLDRGGQPAIAGDLAVAVHASGPRAAVREFGAALNSIDPTKCRQADHGLSLDAVEAKVEAVRRRGGFLGGADT